MDLSNVAPSDRVIDIVQPNGKLTGIKVTICSVQDDRLKKLRRRFQDERLRLEQRGKAYKAEDIEANQSELNFTAIQSWDWGIDPETGEKNVFNGAVPEFTKKNVLEVFDRVPWFKRQITEEISDEASFFKASALT